MINSKQSCGGTTDIERTDTEASHSGTLSPTVSTHNRHNPEPALSALSSQRGLVALKGETERRETDTESETRARERRSPRSMVSQKCQKCQNDHKFLRHKLDTPHTFSRSGTLRARAHTGTHNTPRETTHTDRTDHSHRARATTKLRGVARRASYAVRAAQAVRVAPWRSRSSRWPREGRRRWRRQQSAPVMAPEH